MRSKHSFDVRFRSIRTNNGKRRTTYTVRWKVAGKDFQETFLTAKLADAQRSELVAATKSGLPFDTSTGAPIAPSSFTTAPNEITWLDHAIDFAAMKWPDAAPRYRQSLSDSLTQVTLHLTPTGARPAADAILRNSLRQAFSSSGESQADEVPYLTWLQRHSVHLHDLTDRSVLRELLDGLAFNQDGTRAKQSTIMRRRSALHNALDFAVEREHLTTNPMSEVRRKRQPPTPALDRRRVANPTQAKALLAAVRDQRPELEAFFALMYYAGPRPGEVLNLRRVNLELPKEGWGQILFTSSHQSVGKLWTDDGAVTEERQLKHRAIGDTRLVPAHPELVATLQRHLSTFAVGRDGHLFVSRTGRAGIPLPGPYSKPVSMKTVYRAWNNARLTALTDKEFDSPLARRPYDLRHACVSTWLNAGVLPAQVAEWAGHSVNVLLTVYAKCIDGAEVSAMRKLESAYNTPDNHPEAPHSDHPLEGPAPQTSPRIPPRHPQRTDPHRTPPDMSSPKFGSTPGR
ncbi:integrase [Aeromicrobium panaciterrae]|uniref:tyrosine-type recombinase/integrase n=1 Tax=Aeromicrobium panaciterrae TaxID=363861 RepID=UPI0031D1D248